MSAIATVTSGSNTGAETSDIELAQIALPVISTTRSASDARQPASSDRRAIIVLIASFIVTFNACGINFAFGVYQSLYESLASRQDTPFTEATHAQIDLIGTLSLSLMTIGAPFATAWAKRFPPRNSLILGGILFGLASILASFGTRLWHFELIQGALLGLGTCLSYVPVVAVSPVWYNERRGIAMGFILSGTGVGGLVWAPVLRALINRIGFRNALRFSGALSGLLIAMAGFLIDWPPEMRAQLVLERQGSLFRIPLIDWRVARSRKFAAHALGAALQSAAYYTPVFFFASYATTLGYSSTSGANFVALSNATSAVGKVIIGFLADRFGRLNTLCITTLLSAVVTLTLWMPSTMGTDLACSKALFVSFAVLYGVFAGAYISLFPTSLVELFGIQHFSGVNGVLYMLRGMATLVGTPVAGLLIRGGIAETTHMNYEKASLLVGLLMAGATAAVLWARLEAGGAGAWNWKM